MDVRHTDEGLELRLIDYLLMAIIWSRLGRKELATHLLLQIEEWVEYLGGAV